MFNNCNEYTNGEYFFIEKIKERLNVIFDVGCRKDSLFSNIESTIHYFEPNISFYEFIKNMTNKNKKSFYNCFGLGDKNEDLIYYERYQSFINREKTCGPDNNTKIFSIKKAYDYIIENDINEVNFLKIDVEGYEFNVVKGFEEKIDNVEIIQFEYGGTYKDANIKLVDIIDYLSKYFYNFYYLDSTKIVPIENYSDHYQYSNIICFNKNIEKLDLPKKYNLL